MEKIFDVSGFPVILHLPCVLLAGKANKWETPLSLFGRRLLKVEIWWACSDVLSPGLRIHHYRSRGCHSDLLKVPKDKRRLRSPHRVNFLWHENVESSRNVLLSFTALFKNTRTLKFKSYLHNYCIFTAVNHNYEHKQRTLKHRNTQNGSKSTYCKSQSMTFWTCWSKRLFPKRSAKMIDGCEKCIRQLPFGLQNLCVLKSAVSLDKM